MTGDFNNNIPFVSDSTAGAAPTMGITDGKDEREGSEIIASTEVGAIFTGMWGCLGLDQWQGV